jgi:hypothetical protein
VTAGKGHSTAGKGHAPIVDNRAPTAGKVHTRLGQRVRGSTRTRARPRFSIPRRRAVAEADIDGPVVDVGPPVLDLDLSLLPVSRFVTRVRGPNGSTRDAAEAAQSAELVPIRHATTVLMPAMEAGDAGWHGPSEFCDKPYNGPEIPVQGGNATATQEAFSSSRPHLHAIRPVSSVPLVCLSGSLPKCGPTKRTNDPAPSRGRVASPGAIIGVL